MLLRRILRILPVLLTVAAASAQVTVSVRDTSARQVDTVLIPIDLSGLSAGDSVYSIQTTFGTGTPGVKVVGVESSGTLSSGASVTYNAVQAKLAIAWTTPVTSAGVVTRIRVAVNGSAGYTYTISMSGLQINEGSPSATPDFGSLYIRYVGVQPHAPFGVVVGDTVQFSAAGNPVLPLSWTSSAPSVGTVNASGRFVALAQGSVRISVVDGEGKRDSTDLFAVNPASLRSLMVSVPDTSRTQTLEIGIPIRVTDVTGLGIVSAQFRLTYSTQSLEYLGNVSTGTLTDGWSAPVVNTTTPGSLQFALAGTTALTGSGPLVVVRFRVKPSYLSATQISLQNVEFNEGILASVHNGTFTPVAAPTIVAQPDRYSALKGEAIPLMSTTGGTAPYVYASSNPAAATVDASTGLVTVLTRGPVRILVTDADGFPGASDTIRTYDFDASLPVSGVLRTDSIDVPLTIGNTSGLGISAYRFKLMYDTSVVIFRSVQTGGTLSDGYAVDARDTAGTITVGGAGAVAVTGSGELLRLRFVPKQAAANADSTDLSLLSIQFNEPGPSTPAARPVSGRLGVIVPNAAPHFVVAQADTSIPEGVTYDKTYTAADADGNVIEYAVVTGPPGATIVDSTGRFVYVAGYADAGSYPTAIVASDGIDTDTLAFVLTVTNVNRPPAFTAELPDTTIAEGSVLSYPFAATDPDGETVTFSKVSGPAGASIDGSSGLFSWTIGYTDAGVDTIVIRVTDGSLSDTARAIVTVVNVNRPPVFSVVLQSDTVLPGQVVSVTYQATDPDNDPIRYRIVIAPPAALLDSVTGAFTWTPVVADTGAHVITVIAVAGADADTTEATIVVKAGSGPTGVTDAAQVPDGFSLGQNYPNPFNPSTTISIGLPTASSVRLELYNILGQMITVLFEGSMGAGYHQLTWEATVPTGMYLYRLQATPRDGSAKPFVSVRRMILSR